MKLAVILLLSACSTVGVEPGLVYRCEVSVITGDVAARTQVLTLCEASLHDATREAAEICWSWIDYPAQHCDGRCDRESLFAICLREAP